MNEILFAFIAFVDLQNQELKENLKYWKEKSQEDTQEVEKLSEQVDDCNVIIDRFLIASGKSKDITQPDEFEEVFEDIEQTYSEYEELKKENGELKSQITSQDCEIYDLKSKNDSIQNIADDLQRRNHDLTQMLETKEKELKRVDKQKDKWREEAERLRNTLDKIEDIVNEPCVAEEDCKHCLSNCEHKDILNMIAKTQENLKCR